MALLLSELESLLDELIRARSSGEARVSYGDEQVVYRSVEEIDRAISRLELQIAEAKGEKRVPRKRHYVTRTGW